MLTMTNTIFKQDYFTQIGGDSLQRMTLIWPGIFSLTYFLQKLIKYAPLKILT